MIIGLARQLGHCVLIGFHWESASGTAVRSIAAACLQRELSQAFCHTCWKIYIFCGSCYKAKNGTWSNSKKAIFTKSILSEHDVTMIMPRIEPKHDLCVLIKPWNMRPMIISRQHLGREVAIIMTWFMPWQLYIYLGIQCQLVDL